MKITTYILTDSEGEPEVVSSVEEIKNILIDILNYEYEKYPDIKEIELKEVERLCSLLKKNKTKRFSFYLDERELGVYKKELNISCGY
jgi:hypothetical protein